MLNDQEREIKIKQASEAYSKFMDVVLPNWQNESNSKDTPNRVAKMWVNELLAGVYGEPPKITSFPNEDKYCGIVFQGNIDIKSMCSHHHAFFAGKAFIAYIPKEEGKIIGLSKLNRLANYKSRNVQVQENLTQQIHKAVEECIGENDGIAIYIEASHSCVSHRGANQDSVMRTAKLSGLFFTNEIGTRQEFYSMVERTKNNFKS